MSSLLFIGVESLCASKKPSSLNFNTLSWVKYQIEGSSARCKVSLGHGRLRLSSRIVGWS